MVFKKLTLWENMSWTVIGNLFYSLSQWFILIILAKLGTPELMGIYLYGLAITAPIIFFFEMDLRTILVTDAKGSMVFSDYLGTRILSLVFAISIICALSLLLGFDGATIAIVILIGVAKAIESLSDIFHGQLQKYERMDYISKSQMLKGALTLLSFWMLIAFTDNLNLAIIGQIIIWMFILLFVDSQILRKYTLIKPSFHRLTMKSLITVAFPLGIVALLTSFNTNLPNYFVEYYLGKEELGYFGGLLYLLFAGNRLVNALRQPTSPILSVMYERKEFREFHQLLIKMLIIGFSIGVIGIIVTYLGGELIISIMYSTEYTRYVKEFELIMLSGIFLFPLMFLDTAVDAARYFRIQPYIVLFWIIVTIFISFLLIPRYGLMGAAYVVLLSSFVKFLSYVIVYVYILRRAKGLQELPNKQAI